VGVEGGAGEEAEGEVVLSADTAEAVDGVFDVRGGLSDVAGRVALGGEEVSATEGEVVERDVDRDIMHPGPFQRLGGTCENVCRKPRIEEHVAVAKSWKRVEQRMARLTLLLRALRLLKQGGGFLLATERVLCRSKCCDVTHEMKHIVGFQSQLDAALGNRHGLREVAVDSEQIAEIAGGDSSVHEVTHCEIPI